MATTYEVPYRPRRFAGNGKRTALMAARVAPEEAERWRAAAAARGLTVSALLEQAVTAYAPEVAQAS